jgi:2-polyprenyl-3-methyl-5-hydroxy-6-metoxy-1,4-benzoquinol methylase
MSSLKDQTDLTWQMSSKTIEKRRECRLCGSNELTLEIQVPHSHLADHYAKKRKVGGPLYALDLYQCQSCGHVQTIHVAPLEELFDNTYTYKPSNNKALLRHFEYYAEIYQMQLREKPKRCLDIGSNDGLFLKCLKEKYGCDVLGIDAAEAPAKYASSTGIETISEFFNENLAADLKTKQGCFDYISANNVFAHNDDMNGFTRGIANLLPDGGIFSTEFSYLKDIVEKTLLGTIFHEHLSHHSITSLSIFLEKHGLYLFHAEAVNTQGGAIIAYACKGGRIKKSKNLIKLMETEQELGVTTKQYMERFRQNIGELITNFHASLNQARNESKRIIGYGASRSSNLLIQWLQVNNLIDFVVDNNPEKIGKYYYDSSIQIQSADEFCLEDGDLIIPLAWVHSERITAKLIESSKKIAVLEFSPQVKLSRNF